LLCDKQGGDNEAGYEWSFYHAGDLNQMSAARSIRNSEANGSEDQ